MPSGPVERYDFFLSRRGSVAAIAQEVTDVLKESGYEVIVQDCDFQIGESWVLAIHDCIKSSRDLIILFTSDYEKSQYTREEFASFWKKQADEPDKHRIIVLRCEDVQPEGLLSHNVFQDLVGVTDAEERKQRILAAAKRRSAAPPAAPTTVHWGATRIASFTGRADELDRLDAAVTQASVGRAAVLAICEKAFGPEHPRTHRTRRELARLLLATSQPTEALALSEAALAAHDEALGRDHAWTKDSARVTADTLDALGRAEKAKALRERYGVTEAEKPNPP